MQLNTPVLIYNCTLHDNFYAWPVLLCVMGVNQRCCYSTSSLKKNKKNKKNTTDKAYTLLYPG